MNIQSIINATNKNTQSIEVNNILERIPSEIFFENIYSNLEAQDLKSLLLSAKVFGQKLSDYTKGYPLFLDALKTKTLNISLKNTSEKGLSDWLKLCCKNGNMLRLEILIDSERFNELTELDIQNGLITALENGHLNVVNAFVIKNSEYLSKVLYKASKEGRSDIVCALMNFEKSVALEDLIRALSIATEEKHHDIVHALMDFERSNEIPLKELSWAFGICSEKELLDTLRDMGCERSSESFE